MMNSRKIASVVLFIAVQIALFQALSFVRRQPLNQKLIEAVKKNDLMEVKFCLARGADVNCGDNTKFQSCTNSHPPRTGFTPLILAHNASMRDYLLKHGANPNIGDTSGRTPLLYAAGEGNLSQVQNLLSYGANVNVTDNDGDTPLIESADAGRLKIIKILLAHGADVNAKGFLGFSALARTTGYNNNIKSMKLLLAHGADVNTRNSSGDTPLHAAVYCGRTEAMQILLNHGADPNARNNKKQTPLAIVALYGTKALDKQQDNYRQDKLEQRQELMQKILTNAGAIP